MTSKELNRKAMVLDNKLAPRMGGDRRAAFIEAWIIVKAGAVTLPVKGVMAGNRQEALRRLGNYNPAIVRAFLVPEPSNPVDPTAVAVMVGVNGGRGYYKLGYLPKEQTGIAAALRGKVPAIRVLDGDIRGARKSLGL